MTRGLLGRTIGHARAVAEIRVLSSRARLRLFFGLSDALRRRDLEVRIGRGVLVFPAASRHEDRWTFYEIWRFGEYGDDFSGATVLDFGAHKGYFGLFTRAHGATKVISFEPEPTNFAALARAAEPAGGAWTVSQSAVGMAEGMATLRLAPVSSAHSLLPAQTPSIGELRVAVRPASSLIESAAERASRLIVKIDVEGMECDVVMGTPVDVWRRVDEVYVELHETATCSPEELLAHLGAAGFDVVRLGDAAPRVAYLRR
jgi:FkbM family methyltransferase